MGSQRQWHRIRKAQKENEAYWKWLHDENNRLRDRVAYLERRPPWWRPITLLRWKREAGVQQEAKAAQEGRK